MNDGAQGLRPALERALVGPLPGQAAWSAMAPPYRSADDRVPRAGGGWDREASVLILLRPRAGGLAFPLLERSKVVRHHAGQISLPGGGLESGETPLEAALRETEEETGLRVAPRDVAGALSDIVAAPSRYLVHPFVAFGGALGDIRLCGDESANFFEVGLPSLLDPGSVSEFSRRWEGRDWTVPCYRFGGNIVWGLTAMILAEFSAVLRAALAES